MAGRHGTYLYRRKGSVNWYLRLVFPPELHATEGRRIETSMGTSDRTEAMVRALPQIQAHQQKLLMVRSMMRVKAEAPCDPMTPGEYPQADGSKILATEHELIRFDPNGRFVSAIPNQPSRRLLPPGATPMQTVWQTSAAGALAMGFAPERVARMKFAIPSPRPEPKPKREAGPDPDLKLLDDFLDRQPRTKHYVADARRTWERWKKFVDNRPLEKCTREDGRAFVRHLREQDPPPAPVTVRKWLSLLKAPIAEGLPKHDPRQDIFHRLIGRVEVQTKRLPLSEEDMALFRERALPSQGEEERLLWTMMAATGMRTSECAAVVEEFEEDGIRYLMIGRKTSTSKRRIPIPDALLPLLPKRITGPILTKNHVITGKNLLRAMRRIGITDPRKVPYSLRHRAHDRLRAAGCPRDIQLQIVGHDEATVHDDYGKGDPMPILKRWIEFIGC